MFQHLQIPSVDVLCSGLIELRLAPRQWPSQNLVGGPRCDQLLVGVDGLLDVYPSLDTELKSAPELLVISKASLRHYAKGEGSFNTYGIRRWFWRPRAG